MTNEQPEQFARPFADFLQEQTSHGELTDRLHELIEAVKETGKAGTLQYTVQIRPDKGDSGMMRVVDKIVAKKPEHDRPTRLHWIDRHGNLTRSNPHQPTFEGLQVLENHHPNRPQPINNEKEA